MFDTPDMFHGVWSGAGGWLAAMALLGLGIALLLWRWWVGVARAVRRPVLRRVTGDEGTATIEFALVFPVLLVMILALIQTTFAFTGVLFVNYAAFAAARTAIVEVPRDLGAPEGVNEVVGVNSQKRENIRSAAAFALMPVSGPGNGAGLGSGDTVGDAVDAIYTAEGLDAPRWSQSLVDRRLAYALEHTDVELRALGEVPPQPDVFFEQSIGIAGTEFGYVVSPNATSGARFRYGPRDPIQVVVRHRFHLSVPFVGRLFGNGTHSVDGAATPYRVIESDFMLTNEGIWRALPDESTVERRT
ncbi:MAG: TadE family protein [Planctomycetota bacterium]